MRYIFFTKSMWDEPPRMRHQLARLLLSANRQVAFFQRPRSLCEAEVKRTAASKETGLQLLRTRQFIHHQLRIVPFLQNLNALYETHSIQMAGLEIRPEDVIVNFNYDYFFLRNMFAGNKICTVINDDFVAQSRLRRGEHARQALERTCARSDLVLTVSYPLMRQLERYCNPILFLPWADCCYSQPEPDADRNSILLWGHITERIDFDLLDYCCARRPQFQFHLVGPSSGSASSRLAKLARLPNVVLRGPTSLVDLRMEAFFAAILPYKQNLREVAAITLANKSLQLMARGVPLVTHGMPEFLNHAAILKTESSAEFVASLDECKHRYKNYQESIKTLIDSNQAEDRLQMFDGLVGETA